MSKFEVSKLPEEYVQTYVTFFEKQGMRNVEPSVVEEILWDMASQGVETPDYPRYYALGNKEEKRVFKKIESVSEGTPWEDRIKIGDKYYNIACNLVEDTKDTSKG